MATKPNPYSDSDGNWHWPEKTWFRERLNALKAQEVKQRRKPVAKSAKSKVVVQPEPIDAEPSKID